MTRPLLLAAGFLALSVTPGGRAPVSDTLRAGAVSTIALSRAHPDTVRSFMRKPGTGELKLVSTQVVHFIQDVRRLEVRVVHDPGDGRITTRRTVVDPGTLAMIEEDVHSPADSAHVEVRGGRITGWAVPRGGQRSRLDRPWPQPVFPDDGLAPWILGRLVLPQGTHQGVFEVFDVWRGGPRYLPFQEIGYDSLHVGSQVLPLEVFEVKGIGPPGYSQTRWIDPSGRLVQSRLHKGPDDPEYWSVLSLGGHGRTGPYK